MGKLTTEQEASFRSSILGFRPCDHALEGNIWTGAVMSEYLRTTFGVHYKSGMYDERLGLSHQRAYADYGNAVSEDQVAFLHDLKHTLHDADEHHAVLTF
ncbi:MAG: hypothetical protein EAZ92_17095 [Candidatus Kapaibacterium sp.]|nr:MAG: hypothetical protein EAZ92_17095 [Candidatus Kapabacteria bacterium]